MSVIKKLFIWMLVYYWSIGVGLPIIYYFFTGKFVRGYGEGLYICPDRYYIYAALLLSVVILICICIIRLSPEKNNRINSPQISGFSWYYYAVVLYIIISRLIVVGPANKDSFNAVLSGQYSGTIYSYVRLFLDLGALLIIQIMCTAEKVSIFSSCFLYLLYTLLAQSRQGILFIFIILTCVLSAGRKKDNFSYDEPILHHSRRLIKYLLGGAILFAPFLYILTTKSRGHNSGGSISGTIEKIINRCSRLELAGLVLYEKDSGLYNAEVFQRKYGVVNQIKQIVNTIIPGDIFPGDVQPNQYYRTVFLGQSEAFSRKNYVSINTGLPSYLTVKYGYMIAILLSILLIVGLFYVAIRFEKYSISRVIPIMIMTDFLDYFDWVYIFQRLFSICLTIFLFWAIRKICGRISVFGVKRLKFVWKRNETGHF